MTAGLKLVALVCLCSFPCLLQHDAEDDKEKEEDDEDEEDDNHNDKDDD